MNQKFENYWVSELRFEFKPDTEREENVIKELCRRAYERGQEDEK